jgi:hypothetical protein
MLLPSGGFCLIRKKHTDARGWLVLHVDYWETEADQQSGKAPAMRSDHSWGPGHEKIVDLLPHLIRSIDSEWAAGHRGNRNLCPMHKTEGPDKFSFLSHPHVAALEVLP